MTSAGAEGRGMQISQVAQWRLARNLFAVYAELARNAGVCPPPYSSFGADDRPESLQAVSQWFDSVDASLTAANFRTAIAAVAGANAESALYTVAQHLLSKRATDVETRKKIEFVLVQYFLVCSPPSFHSKAVTCRDMSEVLQPLINDSGNSTSESILILANLAERLQNCTSLRELHEILGTLENCKQQMGDAYYEPAALAHVTHAHYLLRVVGRDVMRSAVTEVLRQMEDLRTRGITTLDCRAAGLTDQEVLTVLVAKWKGLNDADIEHRIEEFAPILLGMEKTLSERTASNPQVDAEIAALRSLADRLSTQLAAISQRVQRLETLVPAPGWSPVNDATRMRPVAPAHPAGPIAPIAVRATAPTEPAATPSRPSVEVRPQSSTPQNGNSHS